MTIAVRELEDAYVLCRTLGHAWDPIPYDGERRKDYHLTRSTRMVEFRCTRCHMLRYECWSKVTGDFLLRDYVQPEGYKLSKGEGVRTDMRHEFLRRWDPKTDARPNLRVVGQRNGNGNGKRRRGAA